MIAHSGLMMHPHLLTVAGAAQAWNLFPVYPGRTQPGTLRRANYTLSPGVNVLSEIKFCNGQVVIAKNLPKINVLIPA